MQAFYRCEASRSGAQGPPFDKQSQHKVPEQYDSFPNFIIMLRPGRLLTKKETSNSMLAAADAAADTKPSSGTSTRPVACSPIPCGVRWCVVCGVCGVGVWW